MLCVLKLTLESLNLFGTVFGFAVRVLKLGFFLAKFELYLPERVFGLLSLETLFG